VLSPPMRNADGPCHPAASGAEVEEEPDDVDGFHDSSTLQHQLPNSNFQRSSRSESYVTCISTGAVWELEIGRS
jgi:hypothetical protein